ncbi:MAG TPA: galactokinase [Tepidisphaeraceae bacterium]|nr:galactokinase [Tepidisphaeraceae bacterium]
MQSDSAAIKQKFGQAFGSTPGEKLRVIRAPGRVNLIGEHTDYNDGFVFPMAIEPEVRIVCRGRTDGVVRLASTVFPNELVEFSLQKKIEAGSPTWSNYGRGVAAQLLAAGIPLVGMDALISNTLPVGGGLSSSAAVEVGMALALLTLAGGSLDPTRLALLCQKAERDYAGVPCGIMDQTIVASGRDGHAMLLDCRDNSKTFVKLNPHELRVVIANTMVRHELSGGEYAQRRRQCEEGVTHFRAQRPEVKALRDVTMQEVLDTRQKLSDVVFRRCRHVVGENLRTTEAAKTLAAQNYERFGELMVQSHRSLRDDYEVSCPELDYLAAEAMAVKGVYGARMTGGGFGGCIVALAQPRAVTPLSEHLGKSYTAKFGRQPVVSVTTATGGASVVE